jgi:hypothetical protein
MLGTRTSFLALPLFVGPKALKIAEVDIILVPSCNVVHVFNFRILRMLKFIINMVDNFVEKVFAHFPHCNS